MNPDTIGATVHTLTFSTPNGRVTVELTSDDDFAAIDVTAGWLTFLSPADLEFLNEWFADIAG